MTTVAILADPPAAAAGPLATDTPLSESEATRLYGAMLADVCRTVRSGGADPLVNYRDVGDAPAERLREALADRLPDPGAVRYEVQVGETFAGRVGNTVTHLLTEEDERQVVATTPGAVFLRRDHVGTVGMTLRSEDTVVGPAPGGRVALAGFTEPVDFTDAYAPPAVETLTGRARDAGLSVDFLPTLPVVARGADLADAVAHLRARLRADRVVPDATATAVETLGLRAVEGDGGLVLGRS